MAKKPDPSVPKESSPSAPLARLPKVDRVMRLADVERLYTTGDAPLPRWAVLESVRSEIARLREELKKGTNRTGGAAAPPDAPAPAVSPARIAASARQLLQPTLRPVINATGVVLHTNLGRAPLPLAALQRISALGAGYTTLEYRLFEGQRGSRQEHAQSLLQHLTGAEASLVVNNNAAAVLLMLAGLCGGGEVIVSRGELVEIGGSFRIPDVMRAGGTRLCEVGTTNRTKLADYKNAIHPETRALLKIHRSNFAVVGFTAEVGAAELAGLAHDAGLLCLYDLGSGMLGDAAALCSPRAGKERPLLTQAPTAEPELNPSAPPEGLPSQPEPEIRATLAAGCDVVTFSCDKLLGGPQAGVLCGTRAAIEPLRQHPLLRALRPDKLTLMALCATLELYRDGRLAEIPTLAMLSATAGELRARAERLQALCAATGLAVDILPTHSAVGGGALPLWQPASFAISPRCDAAQARRIEAALRRGPARLGDDAAAPPPAVVARLCDDRLLCDVRTVADHELPALARALVAATLPPPAS
jgi:L-seryl-tRNA(Ser) seleniumtransferase